MAGDLLFSTLLPLIQPAVVGCEAFSVQTSFAVETVSLYGAVVSQAVTALSLVLHPVDDPHGFYTSLQSPSVP